MKWLLGLLLTVGASAAPINSETLIKFTLVARVREGLVFSKRTVDAIPLFALGEFAGDEEYAFSLLKKNEFDATLARLDRAFAEADGRAGCPRHIVREVLARGKELKRESACLDAATAKAYDEARAALH